MANYVKATNFTAKDSLPSGNAGKIVKGAELDTEFTAIASAISSKADLNSPALTGTPTSPTATSGTNTTQVATTAFVKTAIDNLGTIGTMAAQNASAVAITGGTITGITDLAVADGGTGASTLTGVVIGNGTSAMTAVAPGTSGNVLTSNGSTWVSSSAGFLKAMNRVSVLSSSSTGALTSTVSSSTFGGITPSYVLYFVSAYYSGTVNDLRQYIVCFGNTFDSDNILLGHGDDTDQAPSGAFADSTMVLLPYAASQQFHVTNSGSTGNPTLKVWAVGYQT